MILINGCSFSTSRGLQKEFEDLNWVNILSKQLQQPIINLSHEGKSNGWIYRELYSYLIWAKQGLKELPECVIMQTSDFFRDHAFAAQKSRSFKPNNFDSQLFDNRRNVVKLGNHGWHNYLLNNNLDVNDTVSIVGKEIINGKIEKYSVPICDSSRREQQLRYLMQIHSLEQLCKNLNIKFFLFNFWNFHTRIKLDPLYKELNKNNFILKNQQKSFYTYMRQSGFDTTDEMHFNIDGHKFISDIVYNFLQTQIQFDFPSLPKPANNKQPIFDYT